MEQLVHNLGSALNPWGYVLLALVTALEASAFVGLVIPGEAALLLAGFLAFRGRLDLVTAMAAGAAGAVVGDSVGYEIGRRFGEPIRSSRLGRAVGGDRWGRARDFVRRHGAVSVLLGRWVGVLRAVVPAVVGDARMRYPRFLAWNALGAVVWAPVVVGAGYLAGPSYRRLEHLVGRWSLVAAGVVAAGILAVWWIRRRRDGRSDR